MSCLMIVGAFLFGLFVGGLHFDGKTILGHFIDYDPRRRKGDAE
jgi:hypothetical protein